MRASPRGLATSSLIRSAITGTNAELFPSILALHVPLGSRIADVTYGEGVFWRNIPDGDYEVMSTDLKTGTDCRALPYESESLDAVVIDPPYMEGFYRPQARAGSGTHEALSRRYSSGQEEATEHKHQAAVLHFYLTAMREAQRVLRPGGTLIVKCQDAVSAGRQHLTHVDLINAMRDSGMYAKDLFVLVRSGAPSVSRILRQVHARKSHSYFLIFVK